MPLINIIDRRKRKYRFRKVTAIVEAAWHDNHCKDADQVTQPPLGKDGPSYEEKPALSLQEALVWASSFENPVTLYIYDLGKGINIVESHRVDPNKHLMAKA
jgi:hypothetical protein